jgi:hypothetical protein
MRVLRYVVVSVAAHADDTSRAQCLCRIGRSVVFPAAFLLRGGQRPISDFAGIAHVLRSSLAYVHKCTDGELGIPLVLSDAAPASCR